MESKKIIAALVIDDEPSVRQVIKNFLQKIGVKKIALSSDADEGMKMIRENFFDLIFVDCFMPTKNGLELVREIRTETLPNKNKNTPIIFMTGSGHLFGKKGIEAGADFYLPKPFQFRELKEVIQKIEG